MKRQGGGHGSTISSGANHSHGHETDGNLLPLLSTPSLPCCFFHPEHTNPCGALHPSNSKHIKRPSPRWKWSKFGKMFSFLLLIGTFSILFLLKNTTTLRLQGSQTPIQSHEETIDIKEKKLLIEDAGPDVQVSTELHRSRDKHRTSSTNTMILYSRIRPDRTGSVVQDMLLAQAYAFAQQQQRQPSNLVVYGGAICDPYCNSTTVSTVSSILQAWNWTTWLPILMDASNLPRKHMILSDHRIYHGDNHAVTHDWWKNQLLARFVRPPRDRNSNDSDSFRIVLHVRRGDVTLCQTNHDIRKRYLSNQYYQQILRDILSQEQQEHDKIKIVIYSQQESMEVWNETEWMMDHVRSTKISVSVDFRLDDTSDNIVAIWNDMAVADVLILSKSSFSMVPAWLNEEGRIYYTPFWHPPLSHWMVVKNDYIEQERIYQEELQQKYCSLDQKRTSRAPIVHRFALTDN